MALGPPSVIDMLQPGRLGLSLADQGGRNLALNEGFCTQSRTIWPRTNGTWCRHNLRPDVRSGPRSHDGGRGIFGSAMRAEMDAVYFGPPGGQCHLSCIARPPEPPLPDV